MHIMISTGLSNSFFHIWLSCTIYFISKIHFHWYGTYLICSFQFQVEADLGYLQEQRIRLTFFVTTANDSQPLTVVTKNFVLDTTLCPRSASVKITVWYSRC